MRGRMRREPEFAAGRGSSAEISSALIVYCHCILFAPKWVFTRPSGAESLDHQHPLGEGFVHRIPAGSKWAKTASKNYGENAVRRSLLRTSPDQEQPAES